MAIEFEIATDKGKCGDEMNTCPLCESDSGEDNPITLRDIYKGLWKCRDFELSHLWQRSVFLATFLILVFTGYGKLLDIHYSSESNLKGIVFHMMALAVSWVGMIVSTLWICMAKGSKAWYERYEKAIGDFVRRYGKGSDHMAFSSDEVANVAGFDYWKMASVEDLESREKALMRNMAAFNLSGANYSPSRINVSVGVLAFLVWTAVSMVHTGVIAYIYKPSMSWRAAMAAAVMGTLAATSCCMWFASDASPIASKWE